MLLNPIQSRNLFSHALRHGYAILAVNADSPAAITDCLEAAWLANAPIIIETSLWQLTGHSFGAGDATVGMERYLVQLVVLANSLRYQHVPVVFHTDHIKGELTLPLLQSAIEGLPIRFGDQLVMVSPSTISLDSSEMTEEQNISSMISLCARSLRSGRPVTLEMEAGVDDGLTSPETTRILLSGVEQKYPGRIALWAPGVGTRHGLSEGGYPAFSATAVAGQQKLASTITGREIGIALHGSSGLAESSLKDAVRAGVVKVNWSSESLLIRSAAASEYYNTNREKLDPKHPDFKATAMDNGLQAFVSQRYIPKVIERIELLGSADKAQYVS